MSEITNTKNTESQFEPPSLAGICVLVIDDETEACEVVEAMLKHYEARVLTAASGDEALAWLAQPPAGAQPQVLVCDVNMPGEDGYMLLRRWRVYEQANHLTPLPAVALTSSGRREDRLQALIAGFQMHLAKPVEPVELAFIVSLLARPY